MPIRPGTTLALLLAAGALACSNRSDLDEERLRVFQLAAFTQLDVLEEQADELWPARPELVAAYEEWLARAQVVVAGLEGHRAELRRLEERATGTGPGGEPVFASVEDAWWHERLVELIARIEVFADPGTGRIEGVAPPDPEDLEGGGWGVARRLELARGLAERTVTGPDARERWSTTIAAVAADPRYGFELVPQLGLVPLGPDPDSGLQEFADVQTGAVPSRGADGRLELTGESGLVFVLIPGGTFAMGAQSANPGRPNHDPEADPAYETPVHEVALEPFFLSKYEMSQGQWLRFTGANPSEYFAGRTHWSVPPAHEITLRNPVESVTWFEAETTLARLGFRLPTEAQWEYAARAGTDTPWWAGDVKEALAGAENLLDESAGLAIPAETAETWMNDRHLFHAPAGTFAANAFGLHDVLGNVHEWCRDWVGNYAEASVRPGDAERIAPAEHLKVFRGGSWQDPAKELRVSRRFTTFPRFGHGTLGVRPARPLER